MKSLLKYFIFIFCCGIQFGTAQEKDKDHLMLTRSDYSFKETASRLDKILKLNNNLTLFAEIQHSEEAKKAGLELSAKNLFIFGNPKQGTLLMQCDQLAGLDLPLKILVYKIENQTKITYSSVNYLKQRYELKKARNLGDLNKALKNIASKVSGNRVKKSGEFKLNKHQGIISEISEFDFQTTYERLVSAIETNLNLQIFSEIDHFKNAEEINLGMRPTRLIIFGNPRIGTPIMQENAKIALELPVKFLVWRDEAGIVKISYNDPAFLVERFKLTKNIPQLEAMKSALENLSMNAAKY
ncbi:Uncharacterized conserved protein, DUF302 family [Salegentibacter holothuriorum]|uniref:Uncharacterized conserved protein, DUF302 family n=1 Tax=Salegentibacter holothuriorum TaxID=241145 RepID=A0A1T5DUB8_9FLAO|nr:DUF302 domain-containing protein [Salegentibacter holothuriorum]SKB75140.1 Uncharacterized conserved protein, DUF302 family [Salegentibacter holothuriorum]